MSKKLSKKEKQQRRLNELKKASVAVSGNSVLPVAHESKSGTANEKVIPESKLSYHLLPLKEIKRSLILNLIYAVFAVAVIVGLRVSGIDFSKVLSLHL